MLALAEKNRSPSAKTPQQQQQQQRNAPEERPYAPRAATKEEREAYMTALTNAFEEDLTKLREVCCTFIPHSQSNLYVHSTCVFLNRRTATCQATATCASS